VAERLNVTAKEKTPGMVIDADLTPKFCLCAARYAVVIQNNPLILPSKTTGVQMTLVETHPTFRSSMSLVLFVILFNRQILYISWRRDQQKDSFLELTLLATKFWTYKAKLLM
jgi:hypothetical protein